MKLKYVLSWILCLSFVTFGMASKNGGEVMEKQCCKSWQMGPFVKVDKPVLSPTDDSVFRCPVKNKDVKWEQMNVYNPAVILKDSKVYLIYRADDQWWKGKYPAGEEFRIFTSRIGLAWSEDGRNFQRLGKPVLYPDNDFMKQYEWAGGTQDLHVI